MLLQELKIPFSLDSGEGIKQDNFNNFLKTSQFIVFQHIFIPLSFKIWVSQSRGTVRGLDCCSSDMTQGDHFLRIWKSCGSSDFVF